MTLPAAARRALGSRRGLGWSLEALRGLATQAQAVSWVSNQSSP